MDLALAIKLSLIDKATSGLRSMQGNVVKLSEASQKMGERWQKAGESISGAGEKVSAVSERMRGAIESILAPALAVETAMAELAVSIPSSSATSAQSLDKLRSAALAWSQEHVQSATEYLAASRQIMAAGFAESQVVEATNVALRVQAAVGGDAAAVARTLAVVYSQLGDKTKPANEELARLGDMLAKTKQLFPTIDVAALTDPLKDVSPIAKQLGVDFAQVAASLGALNAAGLQGGEAGAKLAGLMQGLSAGAKKAGVELKRTATGGLDLVATLAEIEKKFGKVETMSPETKKALEEAFGPDTFKTMTMLLGQTDKLAEAHKEIANSANAASNAQKVLEATTAAQAKITQQQLDALKIEIAAGLAPALKELVPLLQNSIKWFTGFAKEHPDLVRVVGTVFLLVAAVTAVVGPVLLGLGAFVSFAGFMMATVVPALLAGASAAVAFAVALLANPITWIVLAIVAAAILIYVYWEPISGFFKSLWSGISRAFVFYAAFMGAVWNATAGAVIGVFNEIRSAFSVSFIGGLQKAYQLLRPDVILGRIFGAVIPVIISFGARAVAALVAGTAGMRSTIASWRDGFVATIHGAGVAALAALAGIWTSITSEAREALIGIQNSLYDTFVVGIQGDLQSVLTIISSFSLASAGEKIVETLVAGMKAAADKPAKAMQGIVQKVRDYLPFSPAKVGPLRDLHRVKIVETVADGMSPAPLVDAMAGVAGAARAALAPMPTASVASMPDGGRYSGQGGGGAPTIIINLSQSSPDQGPVAQLEQWLRDPTNAARVYEAAERGRGRAERKAF